MSFVVEMHCRLCSSLSVVVPCHSLTIITHDVLIAREVHGARNTGAWAGLPRIQHWTRAPFESVERNRRDGSNLELDGHCLANPSGFGKLGLYYSESAVSVGTCVSFNTNHARNVVWSEVAMKLDTGCLTQLFLQTGLITPIVVIEHASFDSNCARNAALPCGCVKPHSKWKKGENPKSHGKDGHMMSTTATSFGPAQLVLPAYVYSPILPSYPLPFLPACPAPALSTTLPCLVLSYPTLPFLPACPILPYLLILHSPILSSSFLPYSTLPTLSTCPILCYLPAYPILFYLPACSVLPYLPAYLPICLLYRACSILHT